MIFDRKIFFDGFRRLLDSTISQEQVDGLEFLLGKMESDPFWVHIPQMAYALATTFHEVAGTMQPITERGAIAYFDKYEPSTKIGKNLGNTDKGDGAKFRGRGYVQLTGRANYAKASAVCGVDLIAQPNLALIRDHAYKIMTYGMHQGWYTGKKLDDYIKGSKKDYEGARRIVNGTDKKDLIAGYARSFETILRESLVLTPPPSPISEPVNEIPASGPVPEVPAESQAEAPAEESIEQTIGKWSARWAMIPTAISSFLAGVWSWITGSSENITITLIICGCAVAALYFVTRQFTNGRIKREEISLQREREAREHELRLAELRAKQ